MHYKQKEIGGLSDMFGEQQESQCDRSCGLWGKHGDGDRVSVVIRTRVWGRTRSWMSLEGLVTFALNVMGSHHLIEGPSNLFFYFQKRPAWGGGRILVKNADSNSGLQSANLWKWGYVIYIFNCSQLHPVSTKFCEVLPGPLSHFSFQRPDEQPPFYHLDNAKRGWLPVRLMKLQRDGMLLQTTADLAP